MTLYFVAPKKQTPKSRRVDDEQTLFAPCAQITRTQSTKWSWFSASENYCRHESIISTVRYWIQSTQNAFTARSIASHHSNYLSLEEAAQREDGDTVRSHLDDFLQYLCVFQKLKYLSSKQGVPQFRTVREMFVLIFRYSYCTCYFRCHKAILLKNCTILEDWRYTVR